MIGNLAQLLEHHRSERPSASFGLVRDHELFGEAFSRAAATAAVLLDAGLRPGSRVAIVGSNSRAYMLGWCALQLAGAETALVNPTYPTSLLTEMAHDLQPDAVAWIGLPPAEAVRPTARHIDLTNLPNGVVLIDGQRVAIPLSDERRLPGIDRRSDDIAGFIHTSGTTGTPKFCALTHEYFLRLGRFIADSLMLTRHDTVLAPLPLFHINPMGYGVVGGLVANADVLSAARFSASQFWDDVRSEGVTAVVLHVPPVEILKRATTRDDALGHRVRVVYCADDAFLDEFDVPLSVTGYGSTEGGGLSHAWVWRRGDLSSVPEGVTRYGGRSRADATWRVSEDGEIGIKPTAANVLFEGYMRSGQVQPMVDDEGWFQTGDLGRVDERGNLVFIERRAESIRVKAEYVPISYVEDQFARLSSIDDVAVWRRPSDLVDDEVVLFVVSDRLDLDAVVAVRESLPVFMRPAVVVRVDEIPRDAGVGKIRRRQLDEAHVLETIEVS